MLLKRKGICDFCKNNTTVYYTFISKSISSKFICLDCSKKFALKILLSLKINKE